MSLRAKETYYLRGAAALAILVAADQLTKYLAAAFLKGRGGVPLIPGVFELYYLENRGAAFGIFANRQWFFIMIAAVILAAAVYVYVLLPGEAHFGPLRAVTAVIAAGSIGNMLDRLFRHYVVDFLYFSLIDFPVFNVADCYVVLGAGLMVILVFTVYRDDSFSFLDPRKE